MNSNTPMIETVHLSKRFGKIEAVREVNLHIERGEIFGLLGPNGAGKTTTIGMLCTIVRPTSGRGAIAGYDILRHPSQVRRRVGIVFQDPTLDTILTGRENLELHARLYGIASSERARLIEEMLDLVDLASRADDLTRTYSGGMRRRLELARGLLHRPAVLFLDEPTLGLDPQTRARTWDYIRKMAQKESTTVVLTTHYMEEAESMCDRIGIIDHGRIIALDTPNRLIDSLGGDIVSVQADAIPADAIRSLPFVTGVSVSGPTAQITLQSAQLHLAGLLQMIPQIKSVEMRKPSLNDVFIKLTGRNIRDDNLSSSDSWVETVVRHRQRGK